MVVFYYVNVYQRLSFIALYFYRLFDDKKLFGISAMTSELRLQSLLLYGAVRWHHPEGMWNPLGEISHGKMMDFSDI